MNYSIPTTLNTLHKRNSELTEQRNMSSYNAKQQSCDEPGFIGRGDNYSLALLNVTFEMLFGGQPKEWKDSIPTTALKSLRILDSIRQRLCIIL